MSKHIYAVLGMARGGTSVVARALKALGIELGARLTHADDLWNPTGFWEDNDIVYQINRKVFAVIDKPWMSTCLIDDFAQHQHALQPLKQKAVHLLQKRVHQEQHWGFKDPRTSKLLPFWQEVFVELDLQDNYVIALRRPLSSSRSYCKLGNMDVKTGLLCWLMHMVASIEGSNGRPRVIVSYENMLQQPRHELQRLAQQLGNSIQIKPEELDLYANQFIDKSLHRHSSHEEEFAQDPDMAAVPLCAKVYLLLKRIADDDLSINSDAFQIKWQEIMREFEINYPMYCYINDILMQTRVIGKKLKKTQRSLPWRLVYPLRIVDDYFREKREQRRKV